MSYRRIFAICLLSLLPIAGCSSDDNSGNEAKESCGNGVLDAGEICDGSLFATDAKVCPEGTEGDVSKITCSAACQLVTADACQAVEPSATCGNGALDEGEDCDGSLFADGKKVCPADTTGDPSVVTCGTDCKVVTTACTAQTPVSSCGNGILDDGEACDGSKFAEGKRVCPDGTEGDVNEITCGTDCKVVTTACTTQTPVTCTNECETENEFLCNEDGTYSICMMDEKGCLVLESDACDENSTCNKTVNKCVEKTCAQENICDEATDTTKCVDGNTEAICLDNCWQTLACDAGETCLDENKECKAKPLNETCEGNTYKLCDESGECLTENCTISGQKCVEGEGCTATNFTCDGTTVKISGTDFTYDCSQESKKNLCNSVYGCDEYTCDAGVLKTQIGNEVITQNCAGLGVSCSDKLRDCTCTKDTFTCGELDGKKVYTECVADESESLIEYTYCQSSCDNDQGCDEELEGSLCGNNALDTGEACDTQTSNGVTYTYWKNTTYDNTFYSGYEYRPSCNAYETNTVYISGQPKCVNKSGKCVIDISDCQEATDNDFTNVKTWSFTADNIKQLTLHNVGNKGFKTSSVSENGAYVIGDAWVSGANPNWDAYVLFDGDIELYNTTNTVKISFVIKRASTGPKNVMLQFLDNTKVLGTSEAIAVTEAEKTVSVVKRFDTTPSDFKFKLTGYNAGGNGTISISNLSVAQAQALSAAPVKIQY